MSLKNGFSERGNMPKYMGPPTIFVETSEDDLNKHFHDELWKNLLAKNKIATQGGISKNTTDSITDLFSMSFPNSTLSNSFRKK